ncbi:VCBS domain-containing protein [Glaciecola sp. XM2]|uniref:VCBS domain-containing protein n=1 Tax=Glaciecola sp. XM2 TaxID=1914931 RepID=UPI001BDEA425|nr:VCBS domain-containing protein [Glaciecola sp. XM2]MBT1450782.1 VCBS domain-containing protein [Glaciecola sp. XM2]
MFKKSLILVALATALVGCGSGDNGEVEGNNRGVITITGSDFVAGGQLVASVTDADGIREDTLVYAWSTGATGTSYTITEADEGTVITVSARYTDQAGFTEGVGASTPTILPTLSVSASVVKGPIEGATCNIFEIGEGGFALTPGQASAVSDATGGVTFTNVNFEGAGLISCAGGTYIDESTGEILDAPVLRSVVEVVEGDADSPAPSYVISPLTEMAVQAAGSDLGGFADAASAINERFGIRFDTTQTAPTNVGVIALGAQGAADADRYGSVLALLSQVDADDSDRDIAAILSDVAADLADGSFSEETLDVFETAQLNLQTTSMVAMDVDVALLDAIGSAVGYNNAPVTAIIGGDLSVTVQNTFDQPFNGQVTVIDPNFDEDAIVPQSDVALDFGTFSIDDDGSWSYSVDLTNETVSSLEVGNSVNDIVTIASVDGTTAEINIRVAALTQVAKISDIGNDTGEIRFSVDNLRQGKLSASFSKDVALGSDGNNKDAYITLYGSSGSSSESLIDLRIQGEQTDADGNVIAPRFLVRNTDSPDYPGNIITAPFTENQFYDVEITWDLDANEQITVTIDGEVIGGGSFSTAAVVDSDFTDLDQWFVDGIRAIQFRFGDNDRTIPFGSYFVDNIVVTSDTAGTEVVFEDDFESYGVGETLDGVGSLYSLAIYSEVTVFDVGDGEEEQIPAVFFDLGAAVSSDTTELLTGSVSVIDPNEGEAVIVASTLTGTFGTLSIDEDGAWTYDLDTSNAVIAALISGERETDTFIIESFDGTTAELVITITGVGGLPTGANNVAVIVDTLDSDTGELRYALGDDGPLAQGRVEVSVKRLDDDLGNGDAFITLFNSATNNAGAILDLRIKDDSFEVRSPSGVDTSAATVLLDEFMDVVITWEYPGGDLATLPLVTVEIDGVSFVAEGFTPDNSATGGLTHVAFRFGDNSGVREATGKFTIDDLFIFSDTAGTTEVFSDDFESYADGDSLDTDNPASPYNSSTSEATVETIGEVGGPGTPGNKIAEIRDTDSGDTGELRYALDDAGPLAQGRVELAIKRLDDDLGNGDAFITLFNSATNNAGAILDLRLKDDSFEVRSPSGVDTSAATVVLDQFMNIVITWEYPNGDLEMLPLVTVEVDGVRFTATGFTPDNSATGGLTHVAIRFGDNSGVREATGVVSVDNLAIYSDTAGTTEVFSDDFESYAENDSLDTDNAVSPYNSSTSEAVVGVE